MAEASPLFEAVFQGWREYQENLVATVRPLTSEQLALEATSELRSVGRIILHIVSARTDWLYETLGEKGDEVAAIATWRSTDQPPHTTGELVHGLEVTWSLIQDSLARWTHAELTEPIILPGFEKYPVSRPWVIWHLLEHDLHHGGELAYTLGMHNIPVRLPPPPPED